MTASPAAPFGSLRAQLRCTLEEVLTEELGIRTELRPDTTLQGELGLDSMEVMVVAVELERRFGVDLRAHGAEIRTVGELLGLMECLLLRPAGLRREAP